MSIDKYNEIDWPVEKKAPYFPSHFYKEYLKEILMYIYRLTNKINNKIYIGLTKKTPKYRLSEHLSEVKRNSKHAIHCAIRKYGIDNFSFEVIHEVTTNNREDLINAEIYFIKKYDCCLLDGPDKGYNMTRGGQFMDSEHASINNQKRIKDGTHIFLTEEFDKIRKQLLQDKLSTGTHNFQGTIGSERATRINLERSKSGTNPFSGENGSKLNKSRIENGTHNFIIERTCPHCNLTGKGYNMLRYHFDNCKKLTFDT